MIIDVDMIYSNYVKSTVFSLISDVDYVGADDDMIMWMSKLQVCACNTLVK